MISWSTIKRIHDQ